VRGPDLPWPTSRPLAPVTGRVAAHIRDILGVVLQKELLAGRFELGSEAASGGMGNIYRGRDLQTGSPVAVKLLQTPSATDAARFSREAALLAEVSHPGIVRYLAHGTTRDGRQFLIMEWIEGETLRDRLSGKGLTIVESVKAVQRIAEALSEVHRRGIIHRDIKPGNLMFPGGVVEQVKIVDFGIARRSDDQVGLTRTGFLVGSPGYMAPEQARGDRSGVDHRVDLFALGCVLYECLTGRPPFFGDPLALRAKVLLTCPEPVRYLNLDVSPQLDSLVFQLLSKQRGERPDGAAKLAARLGALPELASKPSAPKVADGAKRSASAVRPRSDSNPAPTFLLFGESSEHMDLSAIQGQDGQWECIDGRWWMAVLTARGAPSEAAADVAHRALKIRAQLPEARMALMVDPSAAHLGELIDRAVTTIATDSLASIFGEGVGAPEGGIRLDDAMAALLEPRFQLTRGSEGLYLQVPVADPAPSK
jgi:hypothetical protein